LEVNPLLQPVPKARIYIATKDGPPDHGGIKKAAERLFGGENRVFLPEIEQVFASYIQLPGLAQFFADLPIEQPEVGRPLGQPEGFRILIGIGQALAALPRDTSPEQGEEEKGYFHVGRDVDWGGGTNGEPHSPSYPSRISTD